MYFRSLYFRVRVIDDSGGGYRSCAVGCSCNGTFLSYAADLRQCPDCHQHCGFVSSASSAGKNRIRNYFRCAACRRFRGLFFMDGAYSDTGFYDGKCCCVYCGNAYHRSRAVFLYVIGTGVRSQRYPFNRFGKKNEESSYRGGQYNHSLCCSCRRSFAGRSCGHRNFSRRFRSWNGAADCLQSASF